MIKYIRRLLKTRFRW